MTMLVTGASRGIGLEYVRQALAAGEAVIATTRTASDALDALAAEYGSLLRIEILDASDFASIDALAGRLAGVPVEILLNNAGLFANAPFPAGMAAQTLDGMDYDFWEKLLRVNVVAPFRLTAKLLPNLLAGTRKTVVMMSSDLGSIGNNQQGASHAYRSSKAALNMLTKGLSLDLKDKGVTVMSMAPGWTKTDLGGPDAMWTVEDSVANQRKIIAGLTFADTGRFIDLTGKPVNW